MSTTKPDLKRLSPFASVISKDSASLSNKDNAVKDSTVSSLSFNLPISLMVNLWVLNLCIPTSFGWNVNGGKLNDASFIAPSISFGVVGSSADIPDASLNVPSFCKNKLIIFPRWNSKSACRLLAFFGVSTVDAPVPSNCLWKKSKELPVIWSMAERLVDVPVIFSTAGLKSKQSLNSNTPVGSGSSGSTLLAV